MKTTSTTSRPPGVDEVADGRDAGARVRARALWGLIGLAAGLSTLGCESPRVARSALPSGPIAARVQGHSWKHGAIAAGVAHTCAIDARGQVACWGHNESGQVGDGTRILRPQPRLVEGIEGATSLVASALGTCAIVAHGAVTCWGNLFGETRPHQGPSAIASLDGVTELALATDLSCALRSDGSVWCWGSDDHAVQVQGLEGSTAIAASYDRVCAVGDRGRVKCFRVDATIGTAETAGSRIDFVPGVTRARALALHQGEGCALLDTQRISCWRFPSDDGSSLHAPATEMSGLEHVIDLQADRTRFIVATEEGHVASFESTPGDGPLKATKLQGADNLARYESIGLGFAHTCGTTRDGFVECWGQNDGALGSHSSAFSQPVPVEVEHLTGVIDLDARGTDVCARRTDGTVACWGPQTFGPARTVMARPPTETQAPTPFAADEIVEMGVRGAEQLMGGAGFWCATFASGSASCWGAATWRPAKYNGRYQAPPPLDVPTPTPDLLDIPNAVAVSDPCALAKDGGVDCQAPAKLDSKRAIFRIPGLSDAKTIAGRCVITARGTVSCWGPPPDVAIDDGAQLLHASARTLPALEKVSALAVGTKHMCAVAGGAVKCWGSNDDGRLGDGSREARVDPVKVVGIDDAKAVAAGANFSCALRASGTVACWGSNVSGALGDGSGIDSDQPTQVKGIDDATAITASAAHACARLRGGQVKCWGQSLRVPLPELVSSEHPRRSKLP